MVSIAAMLYSPFLYSIPQNFESEEKISRTPRCRVEVIDGSQNEIWENDKEDMEMEAQLIESKEQLKGSMEKANGKKVVARVVRELVTRRHQGRKAHRPELEDRYYNAMAENKRIAPEKPCNSDFPAGKAFVDIAKLEVDQYDGLHSDAAAARHGIPYVLLALVPGDARMAKLQSYGANHEHGEAASDEDRVHQLQEMFGDRVWGRWSSTRIAEHIGASIPFVEKYRKIFEEQNGLVRPGEDRFREVTRNGTTFQQKVPSKKAAVAKNRGTLYAKRVSKQLKEFNDAERASFMKELGGNDAKA
jgi:hypothetical protein